MAIQTSPKHSGGKRPNNEAALHAADQALSGQEKREIQSMLLSRIRPDAEQPRDYFDPRSIESFSEDLERDQLDQIKIRALWPEEMARRTPEEVRQGVDHQIVDGERRYWGLLAKGRTRAYVEVRKYRDAEHVLDEQNAQNIEREDMPLSALCRSITRYIDVFHRTQKYLADNQFKKYANGDPDWVGNRYRLWKKVKSDADIVSLLQRHRDVLTHVELIARVDSKALKERMIKAVDDGASVKEIRGMLPQKTPVEPSPPRPRLISQNGISVSRSPSPLANDAPTTAEELEAIAEQQEEEERAAMQSFHDSFDWPDEPEWTAESVSISFQSTLQNLQRAHEKITTAKKRSDFTPLAREAWLTQIRAIQKEAAELERLAQS